MPRTKHRRERPFICYACRWRGEIVPHPDAFCPGCGSTEDLERYSRRRELWRAIWEAEHAPSPTKETEAALQALYAEWESYCELYEHEHGAGTARSMSRQAEAYEEGRRDERRATEGAVRQAARATRFAWEGIHRETGSDIFADTVEIVVQRAFDRVGVAFWVIHQGSMEGPWRTTDGRWSPDRYEEPAARWELDAAWEEAERLAAAPIDQPPPSSGHRSPPQDAA